MEEVAGSIAGLTGAQSFSAIPIVGIGEQSAIIPKALSTLNYVRYVWFTFNQSGSLSTLKIFLYSGEIGAWDMRFNIYARDCLPIFIFIYFFYVFFILEIVLSFFLGLTEVFGLGFASRISGSFGLIDWDLSLPEGRSSIMSSYSRVLLESLRFVFFFGSTFCF